MKKLLLISAILFSTGAWADCGNVQGTYATGECYTKEIAMLKKHLNQAYTKLYKQTNAKKELENAQKAWLVYKEKQCSDFTFADAGASNGQILYDLSCQSDLLKSRIQYIESITTSD